MEDSCKFFFPSTEAKINIHDYTCLNIDKRKQKIHKCKDTITKKKLRNEIFRKSYKNCETKRKKKNIFKK